MQPGASSSMQFLLTMLRFHSSCLKLGCMLYFYSVLSQICVHIHSVAGVEYVLERYLTSILCPLPSPSLFGATESDFFGQVELIRPVANQFLLVSYSGF